MLEKFITFLIEHNALKAYGRNLYREYKTIQKASEFLQGCCRDYDLFMGAFVWSSTKEGAAFWAKLYREWREYRDNNKGDDLFISFVYFYMMAPFENDID
jgi:hypothetical protein